ncbi:hypothetical protein FN846DRAFT_885841 [Sphaerosporella brunnea]|uniref:Uncharacterized protein n=1 Tax=Sphaerosporella brunnea TaxID=1250544 RepID=A0A5J5FBM1_9PEZI|nr:hypothetical protein FN846DRAFT_885841 [Sphaerosporella brunnea]
MPGGQRHAKRPHRTGTRDKSRNTMQKYMTESHMSDPAQHAHIRTIPAAETTRLSWKDREREREERRTGPRGFAVAANEGAVNRRVYHPASTKVGTESSSDKQDTFASKLRGIPTPAEPENRPITAAASYKQTSMQKRPPPLTLVSNAVQAAGAVVPPSPLATPERESAPMLKPSKVVFAPRSIRSGASEGVNINHLMREYGLQATSDPHPQSFVTQKDGSAIREKSQDKAYTTHRRTPSQAAIETLNQLLEQAAEKSAARDDGGSQPAPMENKHAVSGDQSKHEAGSEVKPVPIDTPNYPLARAEVPQGEPQSPTKVKKPMSLVEDLHRLQLQQPPPIDISGRRGGISLPTVRPAEDSDHTGYTPAFPGFTAIDDLDPLRLPSQTPSVLDDYISSEDFEGLGTPETGNYTIPEEFTGQLEIEKGRLFKLDTRRTFLDRLETLGLDTGLQPNFEYDGYHHPELSCNRQAKGVKPSDVTDPWGPHALVGTENGGLEAESKGGAQAPISPNLEIEDPISNATISKFYDHGKVNVEILTEEQKWFFTENQELVLGYNPKILPYNSTPNIPQPIQAREVMAELYRTILEYSPHPMGRMPAKYSEPGPWGRIPLCDPGLKPELFKIREKASIKPAARDPKAEQKWLRETYLDMVRGNVVSPKGQVAPALPRSLPNGDFREEVDITTIATGQQDSNKEPPEILGSEYILTERRKAFVQSLRAFGSNVVA